MNRGYVKLWRKTLDSGLLQSGPAWQLFGYLLLHAAYRPCRTIADGVVADLEPGQAVFSRARAAEALGLSERNVRTALDLLKKLDIVTTRPTSRFTVITFVNWRHYQDERPAADLRGDQRPANARPTPGQQPADAQKERKNINNINNNTASAAPPAEPSLLSLAGPEAEQQPAPAVRPRRRPRGPSAPPPPPDGPCYRAKSGRHLAGRRLEAFERFWADFALPKGKAEAADAWLDIPAMTDALLAHIRHAARAEAARRPELEAKGQTPKWAQGWLNARRWEDDAPRRPAPPGEPARESWDLPPDEIERRRRIGLEQARAWRAAHGGRP